MIDIDLFCDSRWQMAIGQRAAIEGLLAQLEPELAIEVGTAHGGSLRRIATHSREVHSFDLQLGLDRSQFDNVVWHEGDSHRLLPETLARFATEGRNVDFALVDGDHSYDGVKEDLEHLLASDAVARTVVVLHDTMNEDVRAGIESVEFERWPKVAFTDLNFVLQYQHASAAAGAVGGLGLVVVDRTQTNYRSFDESIVLRGRTPGRSAETTLGWRAAAPLRASIGAPARPQSRRCGRAQLVSSLEIARRAGRRSPRPRIRRSTSRRPTAGSSLSPVSARTSADRRLMDRPARTGGRCVRPPRAPRCPKGANPPRRVRTRAPPSAPPGSLPSDRHARPRWAGRTGRPGLAAVKPRARGGRRGSGRGREARARGRKSAVDAGRALRPGRP